VRETARQRLALFVRLWVLRQSEVSPERPLQVIVRFADDRQRLAGSRPAASSRGDPLSHRGRGFATAGVRDDPHGRNLRARNL